MRSSITVTDLEGKLLPVNNFLTPTGRTKSRVPEGDACQTRQKSEEQRTAPCIQA